MDHVAGVRTPLSCQSLTAWYTRVSGSQIFSTARRISSLIASR